ncbi:hypothetical protein EJ05DRAFT_206134 [Pseudovirgaria hyperparasitica]|uniref:Xylanolytic transcriptional activator regulatory domain-containing protein n=1 Tax=Pseudovirgaria hyperparasitica TaxID=470096 RepID=A0A6A6WJG2_9PEZI|nr:uncharacterized protein EJ05DRAFT_206134 [Pseudovirgaria hyperparasitica]KAF2762336.1 hypothetical protein EJ05DRAFT_206134 [Pseudovirgaria hyperparasitica]
MSECKYSDVANAIASVDKSAPRVPQRTKKESVFPPPDPTNVTVPPEIPLPRSLFRQNSLSSTSSSPFLLSNIPNTKHAPSPVFGFSAEHPFANYWTSKGGLSEVIGVLPSKDQADFLISTYFDTVDPVYPMIERHSFYVDYEDFWAMPQEEKHTADPALLSLHLVMYAMGLHFVTGTSEQERSQMAEFYVSAAHQALRISSYLSRVSIRTIQAMILHCYFLMNDNHASDAWSFGGVLMRQAYAMGLNRDPETIVPRGTPQEKLSRLKVWQAVMVQDTFLTVLLKLPPTGTFSDIPVEFLTDNLSNSPFNTSSSINGDSDININPMSISNIAPSNPYPPYELSDREYIRCMWRMGNLVQRIICMPRSLTRPLCNSQREKEDLSGAFRDLFSSFPSHLTVGDRDSISSLAVADPRGFRQNMLCRSVYWHCYMILQADENEAAGVACDVRGALEAARMGLETYFQMWEYMKVDAGVWWVFQHRAFEEALMMARILAIEQEAVSGTPLVSDPLHALVRIDIRRMLEIVEQIGANAPEMQKTRTEVLRNAMQDIQWY